MFDWFFAWWTARRMKLRDRGKVQAVRISEDEMTVQLCPKSRTRLRIGIDEENNTVTYCWRCEIIYVPDDEPPPKGKEPVPEPQEQTPTNVVPFRKSA